MPWMLAPFAGSEATTITSPITTGSPWKKYWPASALSFVSHRTRPVRSSKARNKPLHEPTKTESPTTVGVCASHPPVATCHRTSAWTDDSGCPAAAIADQPDKRSPASWRVMLRYIEDLLRPGAQRTMFSLCRHRSRALSLNAANKTVGPDGPALRGGV
jgi:hypothetical protein